MKVFPSFQLIFASVLFIFNSRTLAQAVFPKTSDFEDTRLVGGLRSPTSFDFGETPGSFIISEKSGGLLSHAQGYSRPLMRLQVSTEGERGLLGVCRDGTDVLVYYTDQTPRNRLSRISLTSLKETSMFQTPVLGPTNHNGGGLRIWKGHAIVSVGDNAQSWTSQDMRTPFGKLIRIPLSGGDSEVWAAGLRNPFRMDVSESFGVVADVGASTAEEINIIQPGANYGWPLREGSSYGGGFVGPVHAYAHQGGRCAIFGIAIYNNSRFGNTYTNAVFFSDYCTKELMFRRENGAVGVFATNVDASEMRVKDGSIYYLSYRSGELRRIQRKGAPTDDHMFLEIPTGQTVYEGASVQFTCKSTGRVRWFKNGKSTWRTSYAFKMAKLKLTDNGTSIECKSTKNGRTISSGAVFVYVMAKVEPPVAVIRLPASGSRFSPNSLIVLEGFGRPERALLRWEVFMHHDDHVHPWMSSPAIANSTRVLHLPGRETEASRSVFFRVALHVEDRVTNLKNMTFVDVHPTPLEPPVVIPAMLLRFRRGPHWTLEGGLHMMKGSGAWVADEIFVDSDRNITVNVSTFDNITVRFAGRKRSGSNVVFPVRSGTWRLRLGPATSNGTATVGNVTIF